MHLSFDPRRFAHGPLPVVLLGGLNIARPLGAAGIPVIVASANRLEPTFASRYCSAPLRLPRDAEPGALVEVLLHAGERIANAAGERAPLFYGNDDWQRIVQQHRVRLARCYRLLLNDPEVADAVIQKDLFEALAARRGLPIPRTLAWEELERFEGPVLAKPRLKFAWDVSPVHMGLFGGRGKARIFENGRALVSDAHAAQLRNELLVQEYVRGGDRDIWSFHGFADEESRLVEWFVGRKVRTYPELTGLSTFLELAHDAGIAELGARIVGALPLKGVFKIDLKRDRETGRAYVLEINARYNLWHSLGAANGVNLPHAAYEYLVHGARPAAAGRYRTAYRWIYLRYDWRAYRELAARGKLTLAAWLGSLARGPLVCQLFSLADPLPFFDQIYHWLRDRLPRVPGRLRRWLSTAS